jgi:hypothetical protein
MKTRNNTAEHLAATFCSPLPCPVCGSEARRGKHGAVECVRYCTRSAMRPTWRECVEDWNSPDFRPGAGPFTRSDLEANVSDQAHEE